MIFFSSKESGKATMSLLPRVNLLVSAEDLGPYAQTVCERLSVRFGFSNVVVRSASVPPDKLLSCSTSSTNDDDDDETPMLFVLLGPPTSSTAVLETDSHVPILSLINTKQSSDPNETALAIAKFCSLASSDFLKKVKKVVFEQRQARLVQDAQLRTRSYKYSQAIAYCLDDTSSHQQPNNGKKYSVVTGNGVAVEGRMRGKVRDRYEINNNRLALVTTDRQSGFDRQLALVPFKGAVLNLTSAYWFNATSHIISNHLIATPHPNVSIVKKCKPFPIEFVVRSYMTGSTSTSIWKNYQNGVRTYCGHNLPEGMTKNQKLEQNLLTPTTKEEEHDRPISMAEIVSENWMTQDDLDVCAAAALKVFALGQQVAAQHGLILVDTKYEFGREDNETGDILLIDEVHTPDSSRYWLASTYEQRMAEGKEPDNIDKEFLRLWFVDKCDPYKDEVLPEAPSDLVAELSRRYITLYEMITWKDFDFDSCCVVGEEKEDAITKAIQSYI